MAWTVIIFIIVLLILVLAHEFGHFVFAKWAQVRVEEFAFGFPPRIVSIKKGDTNYSFNLIPLGGYVKLQGEEGENASDPRSFSSQKFGVKVLIIAAGVLFNLLFAYILISAGYVIGTPIPIDDSISNARAEIRLIEIQKNSPASATDLKVGDVLLSLASPTGQIDASSLKAVRDFIALNKGGNLIVKIRRGSEMLEKRANLRREIKEGEGALGIVMSKIGIEKLGLASALKQGFKDTAELTYFTATNLIKFFGELFGGRASFEEVSGPIGIAKVVGDYSQFGIAFLIKLIALLSISLALINIVPFPGLDGGRIAIAVIEKIKGSPFHWKTNQIVNFTGLVLLIILVIVISYHDILKFAS